MSNPSAYHREPFSDAERAVLGRFFTDVDGPVFALVNLPEVVKGALFARYSRSPKSVRRLFLDEFYDVPDVGIGAIADALGSASDRVDRNRAERIYQRVFTEYGDDSVAQLGGVHLACEQASNLLTKVLERGRLAAYLEQSTRYIFYDQKLGSRYRYAVPPELDATGTGTDYREEMDRLFELYSGLTERLVTHYESVYPKSGDDSDAVYRSTIRAAACDDLRGLLPAATLSNVGMYATGQAYEMLLMRMRAHPLAEVRDYADLILAELRKVIPAFLRRVDQPERGGAWTDYLARTAEAAGRLAAAIEVDPEPRPTVKLVDWDPEGEAKVAAAVLYGAGNLPDDQALAYARSLDAGGRASILRTYAGERANRRHKPGRAFEHTSYRFDILADYGIFRDLQRHRMLTLEWQTLGTDHGYVVPESITTIGVERSWREAMERAAQFHRRLESDAGPAVAQYAVPLAFRIRFSMYLNAREACHMLELRTVRGGHEAYRRVCQEMHRQIGEVAGHTAIAEAMPFVDYSDYGLARLESERRAEQRRARAAED